MCQSTKSADRVNPATISDRDLAIRGQRVTHRNMMLACLHEDAGTAMEYRRIVRESVIPAARQAESAAYDAYLRSGAQTGEDVAGGHGSVSVGPDATRQATYQQLGRLVEAYALAAAGRPLKTVPRSRASQLDDPWTVDAE